jgi:hypothetical protein
VVLARCDLNALFYVNQKPTFMRTKLFFTLAAIAGVQLAVGQTRPVVGQATPVEITNWHELQNMQDNLSATYILANDLNEKTEGYQAYQSGAGFDPIGERAKPFTGKFNGQGHTITGLYINRPTEEMVGLFGFVKRKRYSELKNVALRDVDITGKDYVGALTGHLNDGTCGYGVRIKSVSVCGTVQGNNAVGGLIGSLYDARVSDCHANVTVKGNTGVGGIVGALAFSRAYKCYSVGEVIGDKRVGGIVGSSYGGFVEGSYAHVDECFSLAKINAQSEDVGGIAGKVKAYSASHPFTVHNSHYIGDGAENEFGDFSTDNPRTLVSDNSHAVFEKWDFENTWKVTKRGLPLLTFEDKQKACSIEINDPEKPVEEPADTITTTVTDEPLVSIQISNRKTGQPIDNSTALVFPNPTNGKVTVNLTNIDVKKAQPTLEILNANGKLIAKKSINRDEFSFNLGKYAARGIYFFRVTNNVGKVITTSKVILH